MTFTDLTPEQQINALVEGRRPSENQIELAVYLIDVGVLGNAADAAAYIQAMRDYNRMKREAAGEPEKRVPKAQQIIVALEQLRDKEVEFSPDTPSQLVWIGGINEAISVAGRYV